MNPSDFIYTLHCCWTFGWLTVFPVWVIWKGYSDRQICEISYRFLFLCKGIFFCEARRKNLLFESRSGLSLRDQDLDWESRKPRAAAYASLRGRRLPKRLTTMGTFLPRDVWTSSFSIVFTTLLNNVYGSNSRNLDLTNNSSCFEENACHIGTFLPGGQIERRH